MLTTVLTTQFNSTHFCTIFTKSHFLRGYRFHAKIMHRNRQFNLNLCIIFICSFLDFWGRKIAKRPIDSGRENIVFSMLCGYDVNHLSTTRNALQSVVRVLTAEMRILFLRSGVAVTKQLLNDCRVQTQTHRFCAERMPA